MPHMIFYILISFEDVQCVNASDGVSRKKHPCLRPYGDQTVHFSVHGRGEGLVGEAATAHLDIR